MSNKVLKVWDTRSTTGELMLLYHMMSEDFKINNEEELSYKEFDDLRAYVLCGLQKGTCMMSLYEGDGLRVWRKENEDVVESDESGE